ncbi:hypothetical protein ACM46W_005062, partial [Escherichia coli]
KKSDVALDLDAVVIPDNPHEYKKFAIPQSRDATLFGHLQEGLFCMACDTTATVSSQRTDWLSFCHNRML